MSTKKIIMKQKTASGYDVLHPLTEAAQVANLPQLLKIYLNGIQAGQFNLRNGSNQNIYLSTSADDYDTARFLTKRVLFEPVAQRSAVWAEGEVAYGIDYRDGIAVHCDTPIYNIVDITGRGDHDVPTEPRPIMGMVALNSFEDGNKFYGGYLYDGVFYEDQAHTQEMFMSDGYIYYDMTSGQSNACYNYQSERWYELAIDFGEDIQGYFNPDDSLFYADSDFTTPMSGTEYQIYYDLATGKRYAYIAPCILRNTVADWFFSRRTITIPTCHVTGQGEVGTRVKFQVLIDNDELSFNGIIMDSTEGLIDMWGMNLSMNKYQEKANLVQEIGKANPDLYPSVVAVMDYVNQNS